jgi:hypothetical protein
LVWLILCAFFKLYQDRIKIDRVKFESNEVGQAFNAIRRAAKLTLGFIHGLIWHDLALFGPI